MENQIGRCQNSSTENGIASEDSMRPDEEGIRHSLNLLDEAEDRLTKSIDRGCRIQHSIELFKPFEGRSTNSPNQGMFGPPKVTKITFAAGNEAEYDHVFEGNDDSCLGNLMACLEPLTSIIENAYSQIFEDGNTPTYPIRDQDRLLVQWTCILVVINRSVREQYSRNNRTVKLKPDQESPSFRFSTLFSPASVLAGCDPSDVMLRQISADDWFEVWDCWFNSEDQDLPRVFGGYFLPDLFEASRIGIAELRGSVQRNGEPWNILEFAKPRKKISIEQQSLLDKCSLYGLAVYNLLSNPDFEYHGLAIDNQELIKHFGWSQSMASKSLAEMMDDPVWKKFQRVFMGEVARGHRNRNEDGSSSVDGVDS